MKVIKLRSTDADFLRKECDDEIILNLLNNGHIEEKTFATILTLNDIELEIIDTKLTEMIVDRGITEGEINEFGKRLDALIDLFNHYQ